ncbi:MAG: hypothetical protein KC441_12745 [Anaerolineales bacterium]|nr:hypothetical protein [Anaerolineales bacterium]
MNKTIAVIGAIVAGIGLFIGGFFFGQANGRSVQSGWMMGDGNGQFGPGMMGGDQFGYGMMGSGMMGSFGSSLTDVEPLSIEAAETAVADYLSTLNQDNLALGEIMIFDNHAYAQIIDENTESGAFEVLVDPGSGSVYPEPGPNMMWNTEYGMAMGNMMGGSFGMMGGDQFGNMMGRFGYTPDETIDVTADEAVNLAQEYLDAYLPGKTADETADEFPGYYTLHVLEDGETIGMLSVNAYTGQVFLHHWHGQFVEMVGEDHS